ncbi:MAG: 2,3-bisphosphoglycerate-independent phosphoglycerate mutase, partial [Candidatus Dormibacteraeota bacterium]|nr:2,3-bisphosphoglycerate-independent phosphoglycerate mutase [Candidatus Dormibacteraeota bacterium]
RTASDAAAYARASYAEGVYDEFLLPAAIARDGAEPVGVRPADVVVHFNFRPDRARELSHALVDADFDSFDRGPWREPVDLVTFTSYDESLKVPVVFPKPEVRHTLAEVVADSGLAQFHVAETEKYAHVTYFINGGREEPFPMERRLLVPSSKVATYDLKPEMSAAGITDAALAEMERQQSSLLVMNYANADMVGHTGDLAATIRAVEFLDSCLGRLAQSAEANGYRLLVTADHGNAEYMVDDVTGAAVTSHTTNPVPVILTSEPGPLRAGGGLRDVAPTILSVMGLPVPDEMTGEDLRRVR